MDFSISEPLMLKYGITPEQVDELKALAAKLPVDLIDGARMPIPQIPGLSDVESEVLTLRMLDTIAPMFDVKVEGEELLDIAGYPSMLELMKTADRRLARLRNGAPVNMERGQSVAEFEAGGHAEKPHFHA